MENAVEKEQFDRIFRLINKQPKWDEVHGGHVLNFQGRVTESSVKNFQLCCLDNPEGDNEEVILQFGRVGKHRFTMDFKFPLSPFQAFAFCVTCMDGKIADRKGYEYFRRFSSNSPSTTAAAIPNPNPANSTGSGGGMLGSLTGMIGFSGGGSNNSSERNRGGGDSGNSSDSSRKEGRGKGSGGDDIAESKIDGSMKGNSSSLSGMIPSSQYLKDKWNRSFK
jgi:hypothetical protein